MAANLHDDEVTMLTIEHTFVEAGSELVVKASLKDKMTRRAVLTLYTPEGNTVVKISGGGKDSLRFKLESVSPGVYMAEVKVPATGETTAGFLMVARAGSSERVAKLISAIQMNARADDLSVGKRDAALRKIQSEYRSLGLDDLADDAAAEFDRPCPSDDDEPPLTPTP
jgi:hypothetical protein